ncbi:hypothetical protein Vadar_022298 [Vaccinium darrowii]|uniref:Uncharacterized protein n=1 Tax=Vaccinium darrowii TaxID=229202 RepID=A0ACB7YNY2_9ERIC|nr:hypothetical protein Vadar_022298 [Vaccinium darrowii]
MPKELSTLLELEVLKGFVVGDLKGKEKGTCTLEDLADLPKLKKLRISTDWKDFPSDSELRNLNRFKKLLTLKIEWGGDSQGKSENNPVVQNVSEVRQTGQSAEQQNSGGADMQNPANGINIRERDNADHEADSTATPPSMKRCHWLTLDVPTNCFRKTTTSETNTDASPELPTQLEKLDLLCFSHVEAPNWLMDDQLNKLKKLYVRGGTLRDLGQDGLYGLQAKKKWTVEILRLRFLKKLEMDWMELSEIFPKLIYLEVVKCPKLTLPVRWTGSLDEKTCEIEVNLLLQIKLCCLWLANAPFRSVYR